MIYFAVIILIIYYISNNFAVNTDWIKKFLNIETIKPCGGDCYNEQICDLKLNKCRKNCKDGESFYDIGTEGICCNNTTHEIIENICREKCPTGKIRCGNTDCLDPVNEQCVNGKICNNQYVANKETETGGIIKKCCGKDDIGNQLYPLNGDCVNCLGKKCGSNCCPTKDSSDAKDINHPENKHAGTQCVAPDYCCDPKFVGKDDVTGKEICCQNELCGTKCCSGNKKCNNIAVGGPKCQVKCGDEFCPDDSDLCVNNNGKLKCYPSSCKWEQTNYVPPAIYDKTGGVQKLRSVCLAGGNAITSENPMISISGINPNMSSDTSISLSATETNQRCKTIDACLGKIQQLGLEDTVYNDTLTIKDNNICQGKVNCSNLLPTMEELKTTYNYTQEDKRIDGYYDKTLCPAKKQDGTDDVNCCYDRVTKEFNGYVCPDNQLCYNDILTEQQYCYKKGYTNPSSYNLNNCNNVVEPTIIKNTLTCNCPKGTHAGTKCQFSNFTDCKNNGTVIVDEKTDKFSKCVCNPGFTGINCENIRILKVNEIQSYLGGGVVSGICDGCHIVPGPGISLSLTPILSVSYNNSNLYISTLPRGDVIVDYTAKYKISGFEKTFSGRVTLKHCLQNYYGYFPQVSGTNNFVVQSAKYLVSAAIAVIGIPIDVNVDGTKRYLDWDGSDCPASDVKTTNWFRCSDSNAEKCCKNNLSASGYCDYLYSPCERKSDNLAGNTPALNKSIIESRGVGGYYYQ